MRGKWLHQAPVVTVSCKKRLPVSAQVTFSKFIDAIVTA